METKEQTDRRLSAEAAKWRVSFRESQLENVRLQKKISELEGNGSAKPSPADSSASAGQDTKAEGDGSSSSDLPQDRIEADGAEEVPANIQKLHDELRAELIRRGIEVAGALYPDDALTILEARQQLVVGDDDSLAVLIDGKPTPLSHDSLSKVIGPHFMRAQGVPGAGSKAARPAGDSSGFSYERGLSDQKYFNENRQRMDQEFKTRNSGGGKS